MIWSLRCSSCRQVRTQTCSDAADTLLPQYLPRHLYQTHGDRSQAQRCLTPLRPNREVPPLVKYAKVHDDWKCLLIIYDEEGTEDGIPVVPVWKWLMEV